MAASGGRERLYAFVSHHSACEALRHMAGNEPRWPEKARPLPAPARCVCRQRDFKEFSASHDLAAFGISGRPVDLLISSAAARSRGKQACFHAWSGPIPPGAMLRVSDDLLVSSPEFAIIQLCCAQGKLEPLLDGMVAETRAQQDLLRSLGLDAAAIDDAIALEVPTEWEQRRRLIEAAAMACEFAGTYRLAADGEGPEYHAPRLMRLDDAARMADGVGLGFVSKRAKAACSLAFEDSASPAETSLALMLTMPLDFGGFGLPRPKLNAAVGVSGARGVLTDRDVIRSDMLWERQRVALEYDSSQFHARRGAEQLARDAGRSNALCALGYRVFRVTPELIASLPGLSLLASQMAAALDIALLWPTPIQQRRRERAYLELIALKRRSFLEG